MALQHLGPGGTRAPARGVTGPKLGRGARTRPEPVKHELSDSEIPEPKGFSHLQFDGGK